MMKMALLLFSALIFYAESAIVTGGGSHCSRSSTIDTFFETEDLDSLLGEADAELVAPLLAVQYALFRKRHPNGVILDVGANLGDTSTAILSSWSNLAAQQRLPALSRRKSGCPQRTRILAFEPVSATFEVLAERARAGAWLDMGWVGVRAAVSDRTGRTAIHTLRNEKITPHSSISAKAVTLNLGWVDNGTVRELTGGDLEVSEVPVFRVDDISGHPNMGGITFDRVFLLKTDVEGHDAHVLLGAKVSLTSRLIDWVIFEYSAKWAEVDVFAVDTEEEPVMAEAGVKAADGSAGADSGSVEAGAGSASPTGNGNVLDSLHSVVSWMARRGYLCYLISPSGLIPLWGRYWHPQAGSFYWANVLCGLDNGAMGQGAVEGSAQSHVGPGQDGHDGQAGVQAPGPALSSLVRFVNSGPEGIEGLELPPC